MGFLNNFEFLLEWNMFFLYFVHCSNIKIIIYVHIRKYSSLHVLRLFIFALFMFIIFLTSWIILQIDCGSNFPSYFSLTLVGLAFCHSIQLGLIIAYDCKSCCNSKICTFVRYNRSMKGIS